MDFYFVSCTQGLNWYFNHLRKNFLDSAFLPMPRQLSLLGHFPSLGDHDPEKWFRAGADLGLLAFSAAALLLSAAVRMIL
jgi:hypothetical protein